MGEKLLKRDTQRFSNNEVKTGMVWVAGTDEYPIYRKTITDLTFTAGNNVINHGISNFWFTTKVYGGFTIQSGLFEIIPESCCNNIETFGTSIRDISATTITVLLGTGYTGNRIPVAQRGHLVIEYVKRQ